MGINGFLSRFVWSKENGNSVSHTMCEILKEYLTYRKGEIDDYLFINAYGKQLTKGAFTKTIERYNTDRNINITSIHTFRHSFAKLYIKNSGDVFRLQKLLGNLYDRKKILNDNFESIYKEWKANKITTVKAMKKLSMKKNTFYRRVKEFRDNK
jgi:hypothetical protein